MNYSQVGISNMALLRVGARGAIASISEDSPNAIKVATVWDMILQEVLCERDWKFAKIRAVLAQFATAPLYGYLYAYALPSDYLRLIRPRAREDDRRRPWADVALWPYNQDIPVSPPHVHPYIIENIPDTTGATSGTICLLTDHDNSVYPLYINYVQLITDLTKLTPAFVNSLALRLAAELVIAITEDKAKAEELMAAYRDSLNSSAALNDQADYLRDEAGGHEWVSAGRGRRGWF